MAGAHRGAEAVAVFATVLALAACGTNVEESPSITVGPELPTEADGEDSVDGTDESDPTVTPPTVTSHGPDETETADPTESAQSTGTAEPTETAQPTGTARPTGTAEPTGSAQPTGTAGPTGTAQPTGTGDLPSFTPAGDTVSQDAAGEAQLLITDVRSAVHDGYDRVVLDLSGTGEVGWRAQFVTEAALDGSGAPVDLAGELILRVDLQGMAYPEPGDTAYEGGVLLVDGGELSTVTEILRAVPFEGQVPVFVGTREEAPFRVFRLSDPERLVIDLQHG